MQWQLLSGINNKTDANLNRLLFIFEHFIQLKKHMFKHRLSSFELDIYYQT